MLNSLDLPLGFPHCAGAHAHARPYTMLPSSVVSGRDQSVHLVGVWSV